MHVHLDGHKQILTHLQDRNVLHNTPLWPDQC
jgi:hypothetical protein